MPELFQIFQSHSGIRKKASRRSYTSANKKSGFTIYEGLYKCNGSNVKADI
jgi:hypothetical protein